MVARDIVVRSRRRASNPQAQAPALPMPLARAAAESSPTPILEQVTKAKEQAEADAILTALNATHWNRKQAAAALKIDYKAFLYKMKKLAIDEQKTDLTLTGVA